MDRTQISGPEDRTRVHVIIPAAGRGERFGTGENKLFALLDGKPVIAHTLARFASLQHGDEPLIDSITLVGRGGEIERLGAVCQPVGRAFRGRLAFKTGGASRRESVHLGLLSLDAKYNDIVLVHDGARPLTPAHVILRCIGSAREHGGAIAAYPVTETIKRAAHDGRISETLDRNRLWTAQTPQASTYGRLMDAFELAAADGFQATDEASVLERMGSPPIVVMGARENIKITTPDDLQFAESWLRVESSREARYRVGTGYDIHRFAAGRDLILGGVKIESELGLLGHSDADVALHAICDALLGAAALPDIGHLFPTDDPAYKDADSTELLRQVASRVGAAGYGIGNIDCCIIAEHPKIAPHIDAMRGKISSALGISADRIGIKATTNEGIGALGAGEGIACHATATIYGGAGNS